MTIKFWVLRKLTALFRWLSDVAEKGQQKFDYCEACGGNKWSDPPCVKFPEVS